MGLLPSSLGQATIGVLGAFVVCLLILTILRRRRTPVKALVVLGSGGHTTEMLSMLTALPKETLPKKVFLIASTDANSEGRLLAAYPGARIVRTPRAREVRREMEGEWVRDWVMPM